MHKRGLAVVLAFVAVIAFVLPGAAADGVFPDVPSDHWAYDAVARLASAGLIEGYPDGSFGGDRTFTRYEMAMVFSHIVNRLDRNVEQLVGDQVAARSADLDRQVAEAAADARKALAAALEAQSKADKAAAVAADASTAADDASKQALTADSKAEDALRQAQVALDTSQALQEVANAAKAVADEALALAKRPVGTVHVTESDPALAEEVKALRQLANEANAAAKRAEAVAESVRQQSERDCSECKAAVADAKAIAAKAEALARGAATSDELAAVRQAAQDAAATADRAEKLAQSAAQLEDMTKIAAKANDALELASAADVRARDALAAVDYEKRYRYDESAEAAIRDFVKQSILEETNAIKRDAEALAQRVLALEGRTGTGISAEEAEEIAIRVVGERIRAIAGESGTQIVACEVTRGDVEAVRALVDQKVAVLSKDMERLDKEYAVELQALASRVTSLEDRLARMDQRVSQLGIAPSDVSEPSRGFKEIEDDLAATRGEVASLSGEVAGTQADVAKLAGKVDATNADVAKLAGKVDATDADVAKLAGKVDATNADVAKLAGKVDATDADVAKLAGKVDATDADVAKLAGKVDATDADVAKLAGKVDATDADVAKLAGKVDATNADVAKLAGKVDATDADVAKLAGKVDATDADVAKLAGKVDATDADVAKLAGKVDATDADVAKLAGKVDATDADVAKLAGKVDATDADVAKLAGKVDATDADVAKLAGKVDATDADVATTKRKLAGVEDDLAATKTDLAAAKADLDALRRDIGSTRSELADVGKDVGKVKDDLGPIWQWFQATDRTFGAELVYNRVRGNSLYLNPRAAQKSPIERAAEGQWYDRRQFVKNENFMRFSVGLTTEPAPGATLEGRVYADRDIQLPRWQGAGIEADLTTPGIVESLRIGDLDATHGTNKFSKYVLDPAKWDAQLYRVNGMQGTAALGDRIAVQGLAGHGAIKRLNLTPGTGNDLAGDDMGSLLGVAGQLRLGETSEARFSWLNMRGTLVSGPQAPVSVYAAGMEGTVGTLRYDAEVAAARGGKRPQVGDITVSQSLGSIQWSGEYGYRRPNWQQRLADPTVDGLATPSERFLGVEVAGLKAMGFDTKLAHRSVENVDGKQAVWMLRAGRDMQILVPFTATVEIGSNAADLVANSMMHTMVDIAVEDYAPWSERFVLDAGFRHEQTPLQAEEWDLRWRNASVAAPGSALATEYQNWVADTTRTQGRAKATLYLSSKTGLYAGGRLLKDDPVSATATPPRKMAVAGVFGETTVLGAEVKAQFELLKASGAVPKREFDLSVSRAIGEGKFNAHANLTDGRGTDTKWVNTIDSAFDFHYPVYQNADFQVAGKFVRSRVDDSNAYRDARLSAGLAVGF